MLLLLRRLVLLTEMRLLHLSRELLSWTRMLLLSVIVKIFILIFLIIVYFCYGNSVNYVIVDCRSATRCYIVYLTLRVHYKSTVVVARVLNSYIFLLRRLIFVFVDVFRVLKQVSTNSACSKWNVASRVTSVIGSFSNRSVLTTCQRVLSSFLICLIYLLNLLL